MGKIIKIPSVFIYDSKVVGVSQNNDDGSSRQEIIKREVEEEDVLFLEAEPTNMYDKNAVKVLSKNRNQIGYLSRDLAEKMKPCIENSAEMYIKASWVSGDKMLGVGIRIELVS